MKYYYYIHFKRQDLCGGTSEHTRSVTLNNPIEYVDDVTAIELWIKESFPDTKNVVLISWKSFKGDKRPTDIIDTELDV